MRLSQIMSDLIYNRDYIPIEYLISKYKVSKRTIQSDISYLMRISTNKGFKIHVKRGKGYLLEVVNDKLFNKFLKTLNEKNVFKVKERPHQILAFLSVQNTYVSMDNIANAFQVSKTLIKHDIKKVEQISKNYNMTLEKKSHHGVRIVCSNRDLKQYMCNKYRDGNVFIKTEVDDVVMNFSDVESELINIMNTEKLNINYNELLNIIVFIKVMIYISKKETNKPNKDYEFSKSDSIEKVASAIIDIVENRYNVYFGKDDINELIDILKKNIAKQESDILFTNNLTEDIENCLKRIDKIYDSHFLKDHDLKQFLISHMILLANRYKNKISHKNSFATQLSVVYPMIFDIAIQFCDVFYKKYNIKFSFDEIGFVAMHFAAHMEKEKELKIQSYKKIGVVCTSGGGISYLIKMQLESVFSRSEVKTFSFLQQEELLSYKPDIIFTAVPISYDVNIPVIYIKEFLDDKDLYRIREIIKCDDYNPYTLINEKPTYYSYFSKEFFNIVEDDSYEHLIRNMAEDLEKKGYGKKGYADMVMEREKFVSTVYLNGVCIPHPIETDALKNAISVSILKNPFLSNGREVRIVFMICLKKEQVEIYKDITKKLCQLMREPKYLERLVSVKFFEEFIAVMKEIGGVNYEL
ncbi:BglG family transcription antiterminator [Clostridium sp.]|jgi:lichenan operon transcriptional antiterminator|uniref:BglG family transcription antiterminator n=1 Tax=Clostridium sp. TaxID=1506 RepID=UPI003A5C640B